MQSPAIILIGSQMGENIGAAARAMHNFGLSDLRLVNPRNGWPNQSAIEVARNAKIILDNARIFSSVTEAASDIYHLYATTARPREMVKPVITPRKCANYIWQGMPKKSAIMFGPERTGMANDDILLADSIITIPVSDENTSLNLAQAVSVLCYEYFTYENMTPDKAFSSNEPAPASKQELALFLDNLETELDKKGFFPTTEMHKHMRRNLHNIFTRSNLTSQEVKTLRGVVRRLVGEKSSQ